ncbi:anthranilate phosphoribosyltransferase [Candidatus Micrarchaeota archaeon]|nr:anthranilate phosphoribosyltransferase [Candidatus Micrarchaeota archaeon]MBU1681184.1 anthranilate phosphoribosyltransferase [Candidatus Micrarchaeota archaeon]
MIMELLDKLIAKKDLSEDEASEVVASLIKQEISPVKATAILVALRMKGESEEEITGFAKEMRKSAVSIKPNISNLVDTCGTGGDSSRTINVSTIAAIIAAGAGVPIAKHGNRSVSSKSGSFDVLEKLGVHILEPEAVARSIEELGIGFMFAPLFHPSMKNIMPIRKELGVRSIFNMLGPLTNPASAPNQLIGVYDPALTEKFAGVLKNLGTKHALIVHSEGMDELGLGISKVSELKNGKIENYEIDANEFNIRKRPIPTVASAEESAQFALQVLNGEKGAARDVCTLNAGAAIYVGGLCKTIAEGLELAAHTIDDNSAMEKLEQVKRFGG